MPIQVSMPFDDTLLTVRAQSAPSAKWNSVAKAWAMTGPTANRFFAAANEVLTAQDRHVIILRDGGEVLVGNPEGHSPPPKRVYESKEDRMAKINAPIIALAAKMRAERGVAGAPVVADLREAERILAMEKCR